MTDEKSKKQVKKKKTTTSSEPEVYYVRIIKSDFTSSGNPIFKKCRIHSIGLNILKVWIIRFIMLGKITDDFGIEEIGPEFVAWFKYESEAYACEAMFLGIKNHGTPQCNH